MATMGVAILKMLQGSDLKELNRSLKAYLVPLVGLPGAGKELIGEKEQRVLAKEYVPFLGQLLKICGTKLASIPSTGDVVAVSMADELFAAMVLAMDGLNQLRSQVAGSSSFEMELQRYSLVRRLMAWKRYNTALSQSQVLFSSLCRLTSIQDSKVSTIKQVIPGRNSKGGAVKKKSSAVNPPLYDDSVLSPPREVDVESGLATVLVAAVVDLIWCIAESLEDSPSCFELAARLPEQLAPWISLLDPATASKQSDALFRVIYKLTLIIVTDPTKCERILVQKFCIVTLSHCASSSQCEQYFKVARKLLSTLSAHGSDWCTLSVNICTSVFSEVLSLTEVRGLWNSFDLSELVEWFARSCQSSRQAEHGWFQIHELVKHIQEVFPSSPVIMTGLYAVGLVLTQADTYKLNPQIRIEECRADGHELADLQSLKTLSKDVDFFGKASFLLRCAERALMAWLLLGQAPPVQKAVDNCNVTFRGHSDKDSVEANGRTFSSAARAFHYVQKSFIGFVQVMWNACYARSSSEELPHGLFSSALQRVLQLFYPVVEEGTRRGDLNDNEKDVFRKGRQMALHASLAALRLSLLSHDGVEENSERVRDMILKSQPEEKLWLMSSTYNMGVQLFNIKQYSLACWPLELTNEVAWAKVKSCSIDSKSGASVSETLSEAYAKCVALVDARSRNGEPGKARAVLIGALVQWAQAKAKLLPIKPPQALVRSFVKLICAENQQTVHDAANHKVRSLYSFIGDIQPRLPAGAVGLLLEEEYAICQAMAEQFPDTCRTMREQIVEYLLKELYIGSDFGLQRSRVLTRKCRDSKMHGPENLSSCIEYISESVVVLEAALKDRGKNSSGRNAVLEKNLAVAYSIKGICSYEMDPGSQDFLPNVVLAFNMWRCVLDSDAIPGGLSESEFSSTAAINEEEESVVLLLYMSDLLSIQGYSVLLHEAREVILKVVKNLKQPIAEGDWVDFWMNCRVGHLLCAVPLPTDFLSRVRQTFNATARPEEFWQGHFHLSPGSLLEAHWHSAQDYLDRDYEAAGNSRSTDGNEAIDRLKNMVHVRLSDGQNSSPFILQTAGLYHLISELYFVNGDTHEAISNAKEAFQLRARLFEYVFQRSGKSASGLRSSTTTLDSSGSGDPNSLQLRERMGPSVTCSWPSSVKIQQFLSQPSQWRVLGDYIESVLQVGVIYERMGAVDEAERYLREGHRLALSQNLPWAVASFSSCLGDLHRKRQLWESAERYFIQAKQMLEDWKTSRCCESCILTGKALLEMRTGDLDRHYWFSQQGVRNEHGSDSNVTQNFPAKSLTTALSHYAAAVTGLSEVGEDFVATDVLKEEGSSTTIETQTEMLRSLQLKGKSVSLEILSSNSGETEVSGPKQKKSRQRKSVQTRTDVVSESKAVSTDTEGDISALCDGMRRTTLDSDLVDSSQVESRKSILEPSLTRNGLRSGRRRTRAKVTLQEVGREEIVRLEVIEESSIIKPTSGVIGSGQESHSSACGISGHTFSIEEWPAYQWTHLGRKLMSRVLLQRGKCYVRLGRLDEAARMIDKAMSVLHIPGLQQLEDTAVRRSSYPVEEGALLYHMSRLHLQRARQVYESGRVCQSRNNGGSGRDSCSHGKDTVQCIRWLCCAFSLCHQVPLLLQKIAKLLAILHVPLSMEGPASVPQGSVSSDELAEVAAYFHQASLGTSIRQQHLAALHSKLADAHLEDNQRVHPSLAKTCLEQMQRALRIDPVNESNLGKQATEFWSCLPSSLVCCVSFVSAEDVNLLSSNCFRSVGASDGVTDWVLVTRLSAASKPVVVLLPLLSLLKNSPNCGGPKQSECSSSPYDLSDDENDDCKNSTEDEKTPPPAVYNRRLKHHHPVLQRVAAEFGSVLEESRLSTSGTHPVTTLEEKSIWWKWRMELDRRLFLLIRMVEDSWLGLYKCLLLGEPKEAAVAKSFELCAGYLCELIGSMVTPERSSSIDRSFVRILLQGAGVLTASELEKSIADMLGFLDYSSCDAEADECESECNACKWKAGKAEEYRQIQQVSDAFRAAYLVSAHAGEKDTLKCLIDENNGKRRSTRRLVKGKAGSKSQTPLEIIVQMVSGGSYDPKAPVKRQPLQLILDACSQALPWESLPILRDHEVCRMPSLGTMLAVCIQNQCDSLSEMLKTTAIHQDQAQKVEDKKAKAVKRSSRSAKEAEPEKPLDVTYVNPYNTYYILNPNGDLPSTQAAFEDWFRKQPGWKGKTGTVPTAEEYQRGLQNHDLFVYLGHGSGDQFLSERYVRRLDHCAASLLMGCSSGRLSLRGEYEPFGVVLSYLMAGCPAIIANLWDVTDGDIDRFSRCLLNSWLASNPEMASSGSERGVRDMSDCELAMREGRSVDTAVRSRYTRKSDSQVLENQAAYHAPLEDVHRMGSAIGQSRNACRLPHLIGASPVCYGVPTGVWKQI